MNTLAERVKYAREIKRFSQHDVAEMVNVSQPAYFKIENGQTQKPRNIVEIAQVLGVNPHWLATGQGEMAVNNGVPTSSNIIKDDTQTKQQNPLQMMFTESLANTPKYKSNFKPLPLYDIDDGIFALSDGNSTKKLKDSTTFINADSRAFGVLMSYDLDDIMPTPIKSGDVLIIEPCLPPRNGDLVLLCLNYPNDVRGAIARLFMDMKNNITVQESGKKPEPRPANSIICGVVRKIERDLWDSNSYHRIDNSYNPMRTLLTDKVGD